LTVPSSAFTGCPSPSVIEAGSAKNERYRSHGTSAIRSGAGISAQRKPPPAGRASARAVARGVVSVSRCPARASARQLGAVAPPAPCGDPAGPSEPPEPPTLLLDRQSAVQRHSPPPPRPHPTPPTTPPPPPPPPPP